jgi:hypothetical protein
LFSRSKVLEQVQENARRAKSVVEGLSRSEIFDPTITGKLEEITQSHLLAMPALVRTGITSDRSSSELMVKVPFRGDALMFEFSVNGTTEILKRTILRDDHILFAVPDSDSVDNVTDETLNLIDGNLKLMAAAIANQQTVVEEAVRQGYEVRKRHFEEQDTRDKASKYRTIS